MLALAAGTALALCSLAAHADPSAADKETARALLADGRARFAAKDYTGAVKSFRAAHAIMGVPTTGLDLARGQAAIGLLLDARTTALEVTRMPARPGESPIFTAAREQAAALAAALEGRIPSLVITVKGAEGAAVTVTVDGAPLSAELLGLPRKVDPGQHVITASAPGRTSDPQRVEVREGVTMTTEIALRAVPVVVVAAPPIALAPAGVKAAPPAKGTPAWVWIAGGTGIAALGAGVGFAVDYANVRSTVASKCPGLDCALDQDAVNGLKGRWNRDLGLLIGLGAVGVAGVATAAVGLARHAPAARVEMHAEFVPWVAPGVAGGAFMGVF
jgi:hypothetical protein